MWVDSAGGGLTNTGIELRKVDVESLNRSIASELGRYIDEQHPILMGEMPWDGSRVTALNYPITRNGPALVPPQAVESVVHAGRLCRIRRAGRPGAAEKSRGAPSAARASRGHRVRNRARAERSHRGRPASRQVNAARSRAARRASAPAGSARLSDRGSRRTQGRGAAAEHAARAALRRAWDHRQRFAPSRQARPAGRDYRRRAAATAGVLQLPRLAQRRHGLIVDDDPREERA